MRVAVDRASDGTPLHAPRGELWIDVDEQRVQCHLCGGWYRALAPTHLSHAHGLTADKYRELVGLRPRHAPWAPDLIEAHGARLRARIATEPQLRAVMAEGPALAQRGELQRQARALQSERPANLERQRQLAESAVRGDLQRLGLGPDRTRSYGARWQATALRSTRGSAHTPSTRCRIEWMRTGGRSSAPPLPPGESASDRAG